MNSKKDFPHRKPLLLTQSPLWFKTPWDRMFDILLGKDIIRADETELRDELRDPCLMSAHQPRISFITQLEADSRLQKCKENCLKFKFSLHFCSPEGRNELDIKECVR